MTAEPLQAWMHLTILAWSLCHCNGCDSSSNTSSNDNDTAETSSDTPGELDEEPDSEEQPLELETWRRLEDPSVCVVTEGPNLQPIPYEVLLENECAFVVDEPMHPEYLTYQLICPEQLDFCPTIRWSRHLTECSIVAQPTFVDDELAVVATAAGEVVGYNRHNGEPVFRTILGRTSYSRIAAAPNGVIVVGGYRGASGWGNDTFRAMQSNMLFGIANTGEILWGIESSVFSGYAIASDSTVRFLHEREQIETEEWGRVAIYQLLSLEVATGEPQWCLEIASRNQYSNGPILDSRNNLYLATNYLWKLDPDGELIWRSDKLAFSHDNERPQDYPEDYWPWDYDDCVTTRPALAGGWVFVNFYQGPEVYDAEDGSHLGRLGRYDVNENGFAFAIGTDGMIALRANGGAMRYLSLDINPVESDHALWETVRYGGISWVVAQANGEFLVVFNGLISENTPGVETGIPWWEETFLQGLDSGSWGSTLAIDENGYAQVGTLLGCIHEVDVGSPYAPSGWPVACADAQNSCRSSWPDDGLSFETD